MRAGSICSQDGTETSPTPLGRAMQLEKFENSRSRDAGDSVLYHSLLGLPTGKMGPPLVRHGDFSATWLKHRPQRAYGGLPLVEKSHCESNAKDHLAAKTII